MIQFFLHRLTGLLTQLPSDSLTWRVKVESFKQLQTSVCKNVSLFLFYLHRTLMLTLCSTGDADTPFSALHTYVPDISRLMFFNSSTSPEQTKWKCENILTRLRSWRYPRTFPPSNGWCSSILAPLLNRPNRISSLLNRRRFSIKI